MARSRSPRSSPVERFQHGDQIFRQDGFLLPERGRVGVADAGHDGGDRPVPAVERRAALRAVLANRGEAALYSQNGIGLHAAFGRP
jgi:hypothetical protein